MHETNIAPGLLLSMPHLMDPNFTRAVVLMVEHNDKGSFGLIVNDPTDVATAPLLGSMSIPWNGATDAVIWTGGPVQPTSGWILHSPIGGVTTNSDTTITLLPGISFSTSADILRSIADAPPKQVRVLLGYAGWGPGQLAAEMAQGSWLHADANPDIIFETEATDMWEKALRSTGINPESVVMNAGIN